MLQMVDALEAQEATGGWPLQEDHIQLLMQLYPGSHTSLKCLLDDPKASKSQSSWLQRRQLFSMCLNAEDNSSSIEWRLPVSCLAKTKPEETSIICSPNTLLVDSVRRFELQLQHFEGIASIYSDLQHQNTQMRRRLGWGTMKPMPASESPHPARR